MASNDPCEACGFSPTVKVKYVGDIWIPIDAVSGNELGGNGKGHAGWKYRSFRNKVLRQLEVGQSQSAVNSATGKRRVKFTRWMRPAERPFDDDNLRQGFKPVRDCLRTMGIIRDDSAKWLEAVYAQEIDDCGGISMEVWNFVK